MKSKIMLFFSAFFQVGLVAINVYQISHQHFIGAFVVGFGISLFWSFAIKKIAFGDWQDRLVYCFGAGLGTIVGMLLSTFLYTQI